LCWLCLEGIAAIWAADHASQHLVGHCNLLFTVRTVINNRHQGTPPKANSSELLQEPQVVLPEEANVVNRVLQEQHPLRTHTEGGILPV
jgi:hypothetical protein